MQNLRTDRKRKKHDPSFVWVTEKGDKGSGNPHHHVVMLLDGNRTRHPGNHVNKAKELWADAVETESAEGLVDYGECRDGRHGHFIRRGDQEAFDRALNHFSYIAKTRTKEGVGRGVRNWGRSRSKGG